MSPRRCANARRHSMEISSVVERFCDISLIVFPGSLAAQAAEPYPSRTIRFIVPFPPGGATDVVTRVVAQKLNENWKRQSVVVDNRGGAGGVVGSELAARAAPDGYTLVMGTTGTHAINASLYAKPSY